MAYVGLQPLPAYDYEDQGQFGTCVGNGEAHVLDYEALVSFPGQQIKFSTLFIYRNAKVLEGNWNEGTDPVLGWQGVMQFGVCLEQDYPYSTLTDVHNIPAPSADAVQKALQYKIKGFTNLTSLADIDAALAKKKAVNIGTFVTDNFVQAPDQAFIDLPQGCIDGSHDYVIFAVDDELQHTFDGGKVVTGFYYIQNSWNHQQILKVAKEFIGFHFDFGANLLECAQIVDTGWPVPQPTPAPNVPLVEMWINNPTAQVNGKAVTLEQAPIILNNITLVPIRFVSEALGCTVDWDQSQQKITINK